MLPDDPSGVRPPSADDLMAIADDDWRVVLAHARRALRDLPAAHVTPAVERLRALPANRLRRGRARRDLAQLVADGGQLWRDLRGRLASADVGASMSWLVEGRPRVGEPAMETAPDAELDREIAAAREELDRVRGRLKRTRDERDEARRQLDGARAGREAAERDLELVRDAEVAARERIAELEDELGRAADERDRAVARERRRQEATIQGLRDELSSMRRAEQEREQARQEQQRADEAARAARRARDREEREAARTRRAGAADRAAPGRPSELPPGVAPGTTAHARALLGPHRRVLVDGYNVAKTVRSDLPDEAARRAWLEQALLELAARTDVRPEVYWDGDGGEGATTRMGAIVVSFSSAAMEADDDIEFVVSAAEDDEPLVVVTDDRGLRERVRPYNVDLLDTQAFAWALRG